MFENYQFIFFFISGPDCLHHDVFVPESHRLPEAFEARIDSSKTVDWSLLVGARVVTA